MPRNIEIKARVEDLPAIQRIVEEAADQGPSEFLQIDTFFYCSVGRLKVREFDDSSGQLIYYQRPDVAGPKESVYFVTPTSDPGVMKEILAAANGTRGIVRKQRLVYLIGQTRVHLDTVEGLGTFVELEVVLRDGQPTDDGVVIAKDLLKALEIRENQLVDIAYFDLLHHGEV